MYKQAPWNTGIQHYRPKVHYPFAMTPSELKQPPLHSMNCIFKYFTWQWVKIEDANSHLNGTLPMDQQHLDRVFEVRTAAEEPSKVYHIIGNEYPFDVPTYHISQSHSCRRSAANISIKSGSRPSKRERIFHAALVAFPDNRPAWCRSEHEEARRGALVVRVKNCCKKPSTICLVPAFAGGFTELHFRKTFLVHQSRLLAVPPYTNPFDPYLVQDAVLCCRQKYAFKTRPENSRDLLLVLLGLCNKSTLP